jgi:Fic family protein
MRKTGIYQILGSMNYFIPYPLPPKDPELELSKEIMDLYSQTLLILGKLNEIGHHIPNASRFIKSYVIKEAILSSSIENINTTMIEVFTQQVENSKASKETQLVINYYHALEETVKMIEDQELPIVSKVILHAHKTLMSSGTGDQADPGSYRKQSVRVGNFVPPPAQEIANLMSNLERFINEPSDIPALIKAGIAHVQFETIHPFLDGNGRIGRLLIILMLIQDKILQTPILYPSYYFKKMHMEYYQKLNRVETYGDFEGWILFYLQAIFYSATDSYERAQDIQKLHEQLTEKIKTTSEFSKIQEPALQTLQHLFASPVTNATQLSKNIDKSYNTTQKIIAIFEKTEILQEITAQKRNKLYSFKPYLDILDRP